MPAKGKIRQANFRVPEHPSTRRETRTQKQQKQQKQHINTTTAWQTHKLKSVDPSLPVPDQLACPSGNRRRYPRRATPAVLLLSIHPQTQYISPTAALICLAAMSSQLLLHLARLTTDFDAQADGGAFFALAEPALGTTLHATGDIGRKHGYSFCVEKQCQSCECAIDV